MNLTDPIETDTEAEREVVITRLIRAPRERVFQAWTDPRQVDLWWGPAGFRNQTQRMDVCVGGEWRFDMLAEDGTVFRNLIRYEVVEPPARLAFWHGEPDGSNGFQTRVDFEARGADTFLTMRSIFPTKAARDFVVEHYHAIEGGNSTLDELEAFLARS